MKKEEIEKVLDFPSLDTFKSGRKDTITPYYKLYIWGLKNTYKGTTEELLYGPFKEDLDILKHFANLGWNVSSLWIHEEDFKKLEKLEIDYISKSENITKTYVKKRVLPYHNLQNAPGTFDQSYGIPDWVEPGKIYMRKFARRKNGQEV